MARFGLLLRNEFKLFRTSIPIHLVAIVQPTVMYLLMSVILVHPTFEMYVDRPDTPSGWSLVAAMEEVGSPIGSAYIEPVLVDWTDSEIARQMIVVSEDRGRPLAVQHYGFIDSNLVKNFRNRLTAAGLRLWNAELGDQAVTIQEHPWLDTDVPYTVYFGVALLPMTAFLAASVLGAVLMAQEFEFRTIVEYRLSPAPVSLILAARLTRLVLSALIAVAVLLVATGLVTGSWPRAPWRVGLVMLPVALVAGCLGVLAGLVLRKTIPSFLVGLVGSFVGWIMGSGFGLAAGFGRGYEGISRLTPFTHAVELLFPSYYGARIGTPAASVLFLSCLCAAMLVLVAAAYRWRVVRQIGW
jgi:ABC-type multidrug transport system permease subunit